MGENKYRGKLVLEDGSEFAGEFFGFFGAADGEVVFNTGMTGYPETLTDPSYRGQILVLTYPLIGNYGVPGNEREEGNNLLKFFESERIQIRGLIVADYSHEYSHWNAAKSLGAWLKEHKIPAIYGIDTRAVTKKLREKGVMLGRISVERVERKKGKGAKINTMRTKVPVFEDPNKKNLVAEVSAKEKIIYLPNKYLPNKNEIKKDEIKNSDILDISNIQNNDSDDSHDSLKVLLVDCGVKNNIIKCFLKRGVKVIRVPWDYDFSNEKYDGLFISNGPGDPKQCRETISRIKAALEKKDPEPVFGICLGNQLLALASDADTYKLKYGHRSQNQPCAEAGTKRCYITSQNHGFAVNEKTLQPGWEPWFRNANDGTNEGIRHKTKPFFSVQFHPEATPGPVDTEFLFDKFIELIKINKRAKDAKGKVLGKTL